MRLPGGFPADEFLAHYWQKKPLVIRQAFPGFQSPVSADELAGLACEDTVESRIVIENDNGSPWQLKNGPFPAEQFEQLPETHWTLLVQGLDHWVPAAADLLEHFRFIPNWRLDDVMASYAPPGGSVGPHYDQYDVFLLQAEGHRQWSFGGQCDEASARVEGTPLRILKGWQGSQTVTLAPGDMLYLPPSIGHHGVALDDCITLSVGFRAPTVDDVLTGFSDFLCLQPGANAHLGDPDLKLPDNPGAIPPDAIARLQEVITSRLGDTRQLTLWFGQFATAPKNTDVIVPADTQVTPTGLMQLMGEGGDLRWNEGSRFAYHEFDDSTALFVDGEQFILRGDARALAPVLCRSNVLSGPDIARLAEDAALAELLCKLVNLGHLYFE
ncbi:cupin domain-containing protein [Marinobacter salicampi]|uniref:cupin domain-containing protein n=1 Tax=Marinobacter salicampi TaxID=435907 RepID=UPI00140A2755|nr:cupin domain-containing protein [Marinobacter salicampi]